MANTAMKEVEIMIKITNNKIEKLKRTNAPKNLIDSEKKYLNKLQEFIDLNKN